VFRLSKALLSLQTIDVTVWGKYENGKDFLMVDRIELFTIPLPPTTTEEPATTEEPSEIVLDTEEVLNGWVPGSCVYANDYADHQFEKCRAEIDGDTEFNEGYWSFCHNLHDCRIRYTVTPQIVPTGIQIRAFMTSSGGGSSPVITIIYRNPGGANQFQEFFQEGGGWRTIDFTFKEKLLTGAVRDNSRLLFVLVL